MASPREGTGAFGLKCGHCGSSVRIRNSDGRHICLRILYMQCTNIQCGATYRGMVEVTHQYSPSGRPNPAFHLPTTPQHLRQQDTQSLAAKNNSNQLDILNDSGLFDGTEGLQSS